MIPKIRGRTILYWGDVTPIEEKEGVRIVDSKTGEEVPLELPLWKSILVTLWLPAIILHEMSHYAAAKLFGLKVEGVVLLSYTNPSVAAVHLEEGAMVKEWKYKALLAAPLVTCYPVGLYILHWMESAPGPLLYSLAGFLAVGFIFCSIPDNVRDWLYGRLS